MENINIAWFSHLFLIKEIKKGETPHYLFS